MSPVFTVVSCGTLKEPEGAMVRNVERWYSVWNICRRAKVLNTMSDVWCMLNTKRPGRIFVILCYVRWPYYSHVASETRLPNG